MTRALLALQEVGSCGWYCETCDELWPFGEAPISLDASQTPRCPAGHGELIFVEGDGT